MIQSGTFWAVVLLSSMLFWVIPIRLRPGFLALTSVGYLTMLAPYSVLGLSVWSVAFYALTPDGAEENARRRWLLTGLILGILGYLAYFKYIPPLIAILFPDALERKVVTPLGISYFTFKFIHYAVESARGNVKSRSLTQFFCYIFLFSIFTAGPIERFDHFLSNQETTWRLQSMVEGLTRIVYGLIKKFVIVGMLLNPLYNGMTTATLLERLEVLPTYKVWGFLSITFLVVYMDFSAYSDVAIGTSRLFGFRIMENFNLPVFSPNITAFWNRWHMTLSGWCRTYVYMPVIGLTRNPYLAVYATFLVMGLWHSGTLTRVGWGLYHGTGVVLYMMWSRLKRKRHWNIPQTGVWSYVGIPITIAFVIPSTAFLAVEYEFPIYAAIRILAKLVFIRLPE